MFAYIVPLGGPTDPGFGGGFPSGPRPDNALPGGPPPHPWFPGHGGGGSTLPIYDPARPDNTLPGGPPIDPGFGTGGAGAKLWIVAWLAGHGWVWTPINPPVVDNTLPPAPTTKPIVPGTPAPKPA